MPRSWSDSNCFLYPHPFENWRENWRVCFSFSASFALCFTHIGSSLYIPPFWDLWGGSALIIRQFCVLAIATVRTLPRHWFAVQFLCAWFCRSIFPPIGIVWWRVLLAIVRLSCNSPPIVVQLAFVLRANVTYVSSSRLFSYQQKTNKW